MPNIEQLAKIQGLKVYDTAVPLQFQEALYKLGIESPFGYVWCYDKDSTFGKPVNVLFGLNAIIGAALSCIERLNYQQYKEAPQTVKDCIDQIYSILQGELEGKKPPRFDGPPMKVATYDDCIALVCAVRYAAASGKSYCVSSVVGVVTENWGLLRPYDKALIREWINRVIGDLEECYAKEWQKILDLPVPDANIDTAQEAEKEETSG
jgi:hypothetical protein